MIKNYFRILKKPHAYLQTILKTPVKFQKNRTETVGGVKGTKYLLKTRNHAPRTTRHAPRTTRHAPRTTHHGKPKTVSLHFSSKRRGTIKKPRQLLIFSQSDNLIRIVAINSHTYWQTVQIQISWLLQIYTVCKSRVYPVSAGQGLIFITLWNNLTDDKLMIFFLFFPENRQMQNCFLWFILFAQALQKLP